MHSRKQNILTSTDSATGYSFEMLVDENDNLISDPEALKLTVTGKGGFKGEAAHAELRRRLAESKGKV